MQRGPVASSNSPTQPTPYPDQLRAALAAAIAALANEQNRHQALEAAQHRVHTERHNASDALRNAETNLHEAQRQEDGRRVYAFVNAEDPDVNSPVTVAEATVANAQHQLTKAEELEHALETEIARVETQLGYRRSTLTKAKSEVVCASPEFLALVDEFPKAWMRLRTLKVVLAEILTHLDGNPPEEFYRLSRVHEPLEIRVSYGIDETLMAEWQSALAALQEDADASLPGGHDGSR